MHDVGHIITHIAGEATHLLGEESSKIVHKTYITYTPLSEQQADLYLKTKEYRDYLGQKICHSLFYRGLDGKFHPLKSSKTGKFFTPKQAMNKKNRYKKIIPPEDKIILMTKGIGGLRKPVAFRKETKYDYDSTHHIRFWLCFWNPCMWEQIGIWEKNYKILKNEEVKLVKSCETHTDINI